MLKPIFSLLSPPIYLFSSSSSQPNRRHTCAVRHAPHARARDGNEAIPRRGVVERSRPQEKETALFPTLVLGCYSPLFLTPIGLSGPHRDLHPKVGSSSSKQANGDIKHVRIEIYPELSNLESSKYP